MTQQAKEEKARWGGDVERENCGGGGWGAYPHHPGTPDRDREGAGARAEAIQGVRTHRVTEPQASVAEGLRRHLY